MTKTLDPVKPNPKENKAKEVITEVDKKAEKVITKPAYAMQYKKVFSVILSLPTRVCVTMAIYTGEDTSTLNHQYDALIKKWSLFYLLDYDWRLYKAQLFCESKLKTSAVSPVGARGLAQFMPATWKQISKELKLKNGVTSTDAIQAGAYYMSKLMEQWDSPRSPEDRIKLAQASYNAGIGNILKAQVKSKGKVGYIDIISSLSSVTGSKNSKETINYVAKIWDTWKTMCVTKP